MELKFEKLFKAIDASDTDAFLNFLSEDAVFTFGNLQPVPGKANIRIFLDQFFDSIDHTVHSDINEYNINNVWFTTGHVEYTRKDGSTLEVPFCNKFEMNGGDLIRQYEIFVDNSELYK
jgi:ketosteroid isomerase-like protein